MPDAAYYKENRERLIQYQRNYYQEHKDVYINRRRNNYYENQEKQKAYSQRYRELNPDKYKNYVKKAKEDFLCLYGELCNCCGETIKEFLTIEHRNGQKGVKSSLKRKSTKAYRDAVKEYRPDLYEVLCMNCNHAKGRLGYCPHSQERQT